MIRAHYTLIRGVADSFGVSVEDLLSKRGPRRLMRPRIKVAEALRARGMSSPAIGRLMNRDHTTIAFYLGWCARKPSPASLALPTLGVRQLRALRLASPPKPRSEPETPRLIPYAGAPKGMPHG